MRVRRGTARISLLHSLAIESIGQATMTGNAVAKVFNIEGCAEGSARTQPSLGSDSLTSLEAAGKEAAKGCYKTSKGSHDERMHLKGSILKVDNLGALTSDELIDGRDQAS